MSDEGKISFMQPALDLKGNELLEIIQQRENGTWGNFHLALSALVGNDGANGLSAYELAVEAGYEGDLSQWLTSLRGMSAYDVALASGFVGTEEDWLLSLIGANAYQIAVQQGFSGTRGEWLATLVGPQGIKGDSGPRGYSAYDLAVTQGYEGTELEWLESLIGEPGEDGTNGKSAYLEAVEAGFEGTVEEWLTSLRGTAGIDGKSAYELAIETGFEGTIEQWLTSLRGPQGIQGEKGDRGEQGPAGTGGGGVSPVINYGSDILVLGIDDVGDYIRTTSPAPETAIIIPRDENVAWEDSTELHFERAGDLLVILAAKGVTLNIFEGDDDLGKFSNIVAGRYGTVTIKRVGPNQWTIFGALKQTDPVRQVWLDENEEPYVTADGEILIMGEEQDVQDAVKYVGLTATMSFTAISEPPPMDEPV